MLAQNDLGTYHVSGTRRGAKCQLRLDCSFLEITNQGDKWELRKSKQMNTYIVIHRVRCYKEKKKGAVGREVGCIVFHCLSI